MSQSASGSVSCPRCGTINAAGDQFCGNCGTDLTASAAAASPTPGPAAAGPAPGTAADAPLVRCTTCGTANPATRSFCQKCGSKLAGATPVSAVRPDVIPEVTAPVAPPPAPATPQRSTARRADPLDEGGGISSWLFIAAAGIVVGALVVVVAVMSGSGQPPPPAGASAAPTASELPSPTVRPSQSPSSSASEASLSFVDPSAALGTRRLSVVDGPYPFPQDGASIQRGAAVGALS